MSFCPWNKSLNLVNRTNSEPYEGQDAGTPTSRGLGGLGFRLLKFRLRV